MSKKDKSLHVKLIVNPGAGVPSDAANKLKLVTECLEKNGLKVDLALAKPKVVGFDVVFADPTADVELPDGRVIHIHRSYPQYSIVRETVGNGEWIHQGG